jgi:hypothetical protein
MKSYHLSLVLGVVVFSFSIALAYFTASYLRSQMLFDYWIALSFFALGYVFVGILVSLVFPVSLGLLFSADVLILHILFRYYGEWADPLKLALSGFILLILYAVAGLVFQEKPMISSVPPPPIA